MTDVNKLIGEVFNEISTGLETGAFGEKAVVGVNTFGSEHGIENIVKGAELAQRKDPTIEVVLIGEKVDSDLRQYEASSVEEASDLMEELLDSGEVGACVAMHYAFPIGVSTVGRVVTPATAEEMFIATTTGTSSPHRNEAMLLNAIYGIIAAKSAGIESPTVGILNVDGAGQVERALKKLVDGGYDVNLAESNRSDGGVLMRGNDALQGTPDVMVTDSLTGNILMKMFSSYTTGGAFEATGYGYGPGIGQNYDRNVLIISRASGYPVVAGALEYAADLVKGGLQDVVKAEFKAAKAAGLDAVLEDLQPKAAAPAAEKEAVEVPPKETVTAEIAGIDILELDDAASELWKAGIYAETGMGCTGPVVMVHEDRVAMSVDILTEAGYL